MSLAVRDDRHDTSRIVCACHSENLLARLDRRGIYLFCRRCRCEQCLYWRQILRLFLQFLPLAAGSEPLDCTAVPLDNSETPLIG